MHRMTDSGFGLQFLRYRCPGLDRFGVLSIRNTRQRLEVPGKQVYRLLLC